MAVGLNTGTWETVLRMRDEASQVLREFSGSASKSLEEVGDKSKDAGDKTSSAWSAVGTKVGLAAAAAVGAAATMVKSAIDTADEYNRMAQTIGIGTEALSSLGYTASLADVPLAKLGSNLTIMQRNLAQVAETGKGPAKDWLAKLNLDAQELVRIGPERSIEAIADAMQELPTQAERLAAAQALFGRGGADMVRVLEGGSKALKDSAEEARRFGAVIDGEAARNADQFNDDLTRLQTALGGVGRTIAGELLGPLTEMSGTLVRVAKDSDGLKLIATALGATLKALLTVVEAIATAFKVVGTAIGGVMAAFARIKEGKFWEALITLRDTWRDIASSVEKAWGFVQRLWGSGEGAKKMSFEGGARGGFVNTAFSVPQGEQAGMWSDTLPDAELITARQQEELGLLAQHQQTKEQMEAEHRMRLLDGWSQMEDLRYQSSVRFSRLNLQSSEFFFSQLAALMTTKSKALFQVGKAAAIAETVIQTYRAAQGAFAAMASIPYVGPFLGAAAAAAAVAAGLARIAAIKSTQFGGASAAAPISAGGMSGPVVPASSPLSIQPPGAQAAQAAAPQRVVNVVLSGDPGSPTQSWLRDTLIPGLQDALGDGVTLNVLTT